MYEAQAILVGVAPAPSFSIGVANRSVLVSGVDCSRAGRLRVRRIYIGLGLRKFLGYVSVEFRFEEFEAFHLPTQKFPSVFDGIFQGRVIVRNQFAGRFSFETRGLGIASAYLQAPNVHEDFRTGQVKNGHEGVAVEESSVKAVFVGITQGV